MIRSPKVLLISRKAVSDPRVQRALQQTPVAGALAGGPDDAVAALEVSERVLTASGAPLAIVADFRDALTVISDDSSVEILIEGIPTNGEHSDNPAGS